MLKLPKGLKKKKKGKKSKKDQELFTEAELEQYKREHQFHQEAEEQNVEKNENDEEWSKFAALTTGVDSILKKTQGDLDRIKSTSFFKRVPPTSAQAGQEGSDEKSVVPPPDEKEEKEEQEEEDNAKKLLKLVVELSESEEDSEEDDSAFDTTFTDRVETGELPLAYVPESPVEELDLGPDPFDTGYADKVIKGPEVSNRGKKLVNIGAAVEVLTGKVETAAATTSRARRQRRGIQNLLLESFEANPDANEVPIAPEPVVVKTLLDDPPELSEEVPIDLSVSLHITLQNKKKEGEVDSNAENEIVDDQKILDTLLKRVVTPPKEDTSDWGDFELERSSKESPKKSIQSSNLAILLGTEESDGDDAGDDPFDTTYVEKVVPKPIDYDEDFDPRAAEEESDLNSKEEVDLFAAPKSDKKPPPRPPPANLSASRKDLLSSSHTDLADIVPALEPSADSEGEAEIDPFDTSAVEKLVAPGKTELKYLEQELLDDDDDFDPRAGEEPKPTVEDLRRRKSSLSLQITPATPKIVQFAVPDLLKLEGEAGGKKPLTPYYTRESSLPLEEDLVEEDPFDTSFVPTIAPTSIELDLIEKEILTKPTLQHSISDEDFDPRAVTPVPDQSKSDLLAEAEIHDIKVLTPAKQRDSAEEEDIDPFDTSAATSNLQPSLAELKLLEDELLEKKPESIPSADILSDTQDNSIYVKILTPQQTGSVDIEDAEDFDPFDTSFASNLAPGEVEIKLIENEFIN